MAGLADQGGGIGPWALLGLAQGLMQPSRNFGAALGNGFGGFAQGMQMQGQQQMQRFQMDRMQEQLAKQKETDDALKRLADPASYERPVTKEGDYGMMPAVAPAYPAWTAMATATPPEYGPAPHDKVGDMMRVAPGEVIKSLLNPNGDLPPEIQSMMYYQKHPDLMKVKNFMDPTGPEAQLFAAGIVPGTPEALHFLMNKNRSVTTVNTGENMQERGLAELNKETIKGMQDQFNVSIDQLPQLARMRQNINAGLKTGQMAPVRQAVAGFLTDVLNVDQKTLDTFFNQTEGADFDAASKALTMAGIKAFGANPSNAEREFAAMTVPQIKNNPEAALRLIDRIYTKNSNAVREYGSMMDKLPAGSPNGAMLKGAYETRMGTYKKYASRLNPPVGAPPGTTYAYDDLADGFPIYQIPGENGQPATFKKYKPDGEQ